MNYKVIATGSTGNATIIEDTILIDCGVSYKAIKPYINDIKIVLLTHLHRDHFNTSTIKKIAEERPTMRFGCGSWLVMDLLKLGVDKRNIDVYLLDLEHKYKGFSIIPFQLFHDVSNLGYKIIINNKKIIYATDTNKIDHIEAKDFDLYLIEGNYTEDELEERIKTKLENGEFVHEYRVRKTHLSKEKATEWLLKNMGDNSEYVWMHEHVER